jgi:hypothetical protein
VVEKGGQITVMEGSYGDDAKGLLGVEGAKGGMGEWQPEKDPQTQIMGYGSQILVARGWAGRSV